LELCESFFSRQLYLDQLVLQLAIRFVLLETQVPAVRCYVA
jgi:hypothetical protein